MRKERPSLFVNKINKKIDNSQKIYYSKEDNFNEPKKKTKEKISSNKLTDFKKKETSEKLKILMSLPEYLFNINLEVVTKEEVLNINLAGKTDNDLITTEGNLIPIDKIIDIKVK